jgi:hypothetical protein
MRIFIVIGYNNLIKETEQYNIYYIVNFHRWGRLRRPQVNIICRSQGWRPGSPGPAVPAPGSILSNGNTYKYLER